MCGPKRWRSCSPTACASAAMLSSAAIERALGGHSVGGPGSVTIITTMTTTLRVLVMLLVALPSVAFAQNSGPPRSRMRDFVNESVLSPGRYVLDLGAATIDELSGFPSEWDERANPFGRRYAAGIGMGVAS